MGDVLAGAGRLSQGRVGILCHPAFLVWAETLSQGEAKKAGALWPAPP